MPKASKSNDKHKYAKILAKKCKNKRMRFRVQGVFQETYNAIQRVSELVKDWF